MNRQELVKKTRDLLAKSGFYISDVTDTRSVCFDMLARRDNSLVIIKVLTNVDSFSKQNAHELAILSEMLNGTSLIIGEHTNQKKVERGVVYSRYGVPLINSQTLFDFLLEGVSPLIFSAPGGFYVNIDGEVLQKAREAKKISLGALATIAGVSRKAIQKYEEGMSTVIEVAIRLEEFLNIPLIKPLDPFRLQYSRGDQKIKVDKFSDIEQKIFYQLQVLGYDVVPITRCPFDALTRDKKTLIITGIDNQNRNVAAKARIINNISKITEQYSVIILDKWLRKDNLEGTPIILTEELNKIEDADEILTLIAERS